MKKLWLFLLILHGSLLPMMNTTVMNAKEDTSEEEKSDQELSNLINSISFPQQNSTQKTPEYIFNAFKTIHNYQGNKLVQIIENKNLEPLFNQLQKDWSTMDLSTQLHPELIPFSLIDNHRMQKHIENPYNTYMRTLCKISLECTDMKKTYENENKKLRKQLGNIETERAQLQEKLAALKEERKNIRIKEIKNKIEYQTLCGYTLYLNWAIKNQLDIVNAEVKNIGNTNPNEQEMLLFDIKEKLQNSLQEPTDSYKGSIGKATTLIFGSYSSYVLNPEEKETAQTRIDFVAGWHASQAKYWEEHPITLPVEKN